MNVPKEMKAPQTDGPNLISNDKKRKSKESKQQERRRVRELLRTVDLKDITKVLSGHEDDELDAIDATLLKCCELIRLKYPNLELIPSFSDQYFMLEASEVEGLPETYENPWKKAMAIHRAQVLKQDSKVALTHTSQNRSFDEFLANIDSIDMGDVSPEWIAIEKGFRDLLGPYTRLNHYDWVDNYASFFDSVTASIKDEELFNSVITECIEMLQSALCSLTGEKKIGMHNPEETFYLVTTGTNSGFPFFTRKWDKDPIAVRYYIEQAKEVLKGNFSNMPRMLFRRVQAKGETAKQRPVMCPPKGEAIAAKYFTSELISAFKTIPSLSGQKGSNRVYECFNDLGIFDQEFLISGDFSKFDKNSKVIMPIIIDRVIRGVLSDECKDYVDGLLEYYQQSELITPYGILKTKDGATCGLNSGDGWTSIIGTLCNWVCVNYALRRLSYVPKRKELGDKDSYCCLHYGDDLVIGLNRELDLKAFDEAVAELGMECNPSKQVISKNVFSFLGYYYFRSEWESKPMTDIGWFPMYRACAQMYYCEDLISQESLLGGLEEGDLEEANVKLSYYEVQTLGTISRLSNCQNLPYFREFVEQVMLMDEHLFYPPRFMSQRTCLKALEKKAGKDVEGKSLLDNPVVQVILEYHHLDNVPEDELVKESISWHENKAKERTDMSEVVIKLVGNQLIIESPTGFSNQDLKQILKWFKGAYDVSLVTEDSEEPEVISEASKEEKIEDQANPSSPIGEESQNGKSPETRKDEFNTESKEKLDTQSKGTNFNQGAPSNRPQAEVVATYGKVEGNRRCTQLKVNLEEGSSAGTLKGLLCMFEQKGISVKYADASTQIAIEGKQRIKRST